MIGYFYLENGAEGKPTACVGVTIRLHTTSVKVIEDAVQQLPHGYKCEKEELVLADVGIAGIRRKRQWCGACEFTKSARG